MASILIPATAAVVIVSGRAIADAHRAPRPYELASTAIVFTGAGLLADFNPALGGAVAYAYLIALLLRPSTADFFSKLSGGVQNAAPSF